MRRGGGCTSDCRILFVNSALYGSLMKRRGIVRAERVGTEVHYSLTDTRILEACHLTRDVLLQRLAQQASLVAPNSA